MKTWLYFGSIATLTLNISACQAGEQSCLALYRNVTDSFYEFKSIRKNVNCKADYDKFYLKDGNLYVLFQVTQERWFGTKIFYAADHERTKTYIGEALKLHPGTNVKRLGDNGPPVVDWFPPKA